MKQTLSVAFAFAFLLSPAAASQSITVALYGGQWGAAIENCVLKPFTADTGIATVSEPGSSLVTMTKLKQQVGAPTIDVAWMDGGISELAHVDGLVAEIPANALSDVDKLVPAGIHKDSDGGIFALSTGFYSTGIVYNTSEIATPPKSWFDLWKPEYAGRVTIPSPNNANGIPIFITIARAAGGGLDAIDPGVERLQQLDVALYWDSAGAADNAFQSGEVVIGALHSANAWGMRDQGLPIGYAVPEEGIPAADIRVHVVKDTPKLDAALQLAVFATRKEVSECLAEALYVGPLRTDAALSERASERMPWGGSGSVDDLIFMDWQAVNQRRGELTNIWNEQILAR